MLVKVPDSANLEDKRIERMHDKMGFRPTILFEQDLHQVDETTCRDPLKQRIQKGCR